MIKGSIIIDTERCKGCNLCAVACPKRVIAIDHTKVNHFGYAYAQAVDLDACIGCASCGIVCPDACIMVFKCKM